ncbi:MAG: ABC transporter ATP-binding protein [Deltaproteobacteria bacterium]|nr:ABC transporter ATP-binding protein [Deltaproteobacteria bacterium]
MAEVVLRNVVKKYGKVEAVKGLDLHCKDKEFLVLLGPSGCGKSSTLRMIAGLESISSGDISIAGTKVNQMHPSKRDIAMVFETYALYPHKTVFENMAYPLRIRKMSKHEIKTRVERAAEILEITPMLERYPRQLSGGQKQRVAIGRAIVRDPKVFLMDEPISHLDAKLRSHMRGELKHLHEELNQTFIYVSHDQTEAMSMADRIAVMNLGELQQFDTPERIFNEPVNEFVAGFVGDPPMNFLPATLVTGTEPWSIEFQQFTLAVPDRVRELAQRGTQELTGRHEITLGIRPDNVRLKAEQTKAGDLAGEIYVTEPLGSYMVVDVEVGGERIKVRADISFPGRSKDPIFLELDGAHMHLFDAATSRSLIH